MQQPHQFNDQPAAPQYDARPPDGRPSIGIGPQLAITFGVVIVLGTANGLFGLLVTEALGVSQWVVVGVFALLAAVAGRRMERAGRGDLYAMWSAAWLAWLLAALWALADVTGVWEGILVWLFVAVMLAWRWLDVRRGLRESLFGPLRARSS